MKIAMAALAAVLMAQAAPAMAQDRAEREDRGDRQERLERRDQAQPDRMGAGRSQRDWGGGRATPAPEAAPAPAAPQAQPAPQADRPRFRGDGRYGQPRDQGVNDRRSDGHRDWGGRGDNDRRDWDRRDWDRRDHDRRDWDRRDWDRRGDNDRRDWNGRYDDHRRWERGRYPPAYFSSHRYRHSWRPPSGFYLRSWSFGEFFPRGWYGPGYYIVDPWQYDLPLPPPGYEWVRSGPDALLIDEFSGRIVQIVRNIFWY
jgi:Ni/Co efflux regulator RcnB